MQEAYWSSTPNTFKGLRINHFRSSHLGLGETRMKKTILFIKRQCERVNKTFKGLRILWVFIEMMHLPSYLSYTVCVVTPAFALPALFA